MNGLTQHEPALYLAKQKQHPSFNVSIHYL